MSRIGRLPVAIPAGVTVDIAGKQPRCSKRTKRNIRENSPV